MMPETEGALWRVVGSVEESLRHMSDSLRKLVDEIGELRGDTHEIRASNERLANGVEQTNKRLCDLAVEVHSYHKPVWRPRFRRLWLYFLSNTAPKAVAAALAAAAALGTTSFLEGWWK